MTATGATLRGEVTPRGSTTTAWFEYGLVPSYGLNTPATDVGNGTNWVVISAAILDLLPGTNYHYRLVATNRSGLGFGSDQVFATASQVALPTIGPCALLGSGQFQLQFSAVAGVRYHVLASIDLAD